MAVLSGMKEICQFMKRSESTILDWIFQMQFPAKKMKNGVTSKWMAESEECLVWLRKFISEPGGEVEKPVVKRVIQKAAKKRRF
jgi:predicted DNA-binding transcriptional regulator AlpA